MSLRVAQRQLSARLAEDGSGSAAGKGAGKGAGKASQGKAPKPAKRKKVKTTAPKLSGVEKATLARKASNHTAANLRLLK